jgi:hypothetical protein
VPESPGDSQHNRLSWGLIPAIPLFVYGIAALILGGSGLLFVPGILLGGISIGKNTTLLRVFGWVLLHATALAPGWAIIVAASSLSKPRWKRAAKALAIATAMVLGLAIAASCFR